MYKWSFWTIYGKGFPRWCSVGCRGVWQQCQSALSLVAVTPPWSTLPPEPLSTAAAPPGWFSWGPHEGWVSQQLLSPEKQNNNTMEQGPAAAFQVCPTSVTLHLPAALWSHMQSAIAAASPLEASRHPVTPTAALLPGDRDATCPHLPWSRISSLSACWSYFLTNGLRKMVNWVSFFRGFEERVTYFSIICIYLGDNPASSGLPTSATNHCFPG